ncbi:uncharacterized protein LOC115626538 [Scaptodrosophila lebanonensis]|uniref:Uncharacterized protein LOC115626538 n=1 Tax=Drosophila lebanonensis TaxID=7225 RepID=A0A6J2TRP3_DROLE|nr:uncharacterized protein LOC115626538 [Scaptodrosophila lebanonensis]
MPGIWAQLLPNRGYDIRIHIFDFRVDDSEIILSNAFKLEQELDRSYVSGYLMFSQQLEPINMVAVLNVTRSHMPSLRMFNTQIDACRMLNNGYKNKFVKQIYNTFFTFVNTRPKCPLKANFNYTLTRAYVDEKLFPDFLPDCNISISLQFEHKSKSLALLNISGRLRSLGKSGKEVHKS